MSERPTIAVGTHVYVKDHKKSGIVIGHADRAKTFADRDVCVYDRVFAVRIPTWYGDRTLWEDGDGLFIIAAKP